MPTPNLVIAWCSIALQFCAAVILCRKSHRFPAMTAFSSCSLVVVWLALAGYNHAWTIGAWTMIVFKLAVAAECVLLLLVEHDDYADYLKTVVLASIAAGLIAHVTSSQASVLYTSRLICHAVCTAACGSALFTMRRGTPSYRLHVAIAVCYFLGLTLADIQAPHQLNARYWQIHLALAGFQAACWGGWLLLFNGLRHSTADPVFRPSATTAA